MQSRWATRVEKIDLAGIAARLEAESRLISALVAAVFEVFFFFFFFFSLFFFYPPPPEDTKKMHPDKLNSNLLPLKEMLRDPFQRKCILAYATKNYQVRFCTCWRHLRWGGTALRSFNFSDFPPFLLRTNRCSFGLQRMIFWNCLRKPGLRPRMRFGASF
jgi:hypothetical protein